MIYSYSMQTVALCVGALWLLLHLPGILAPGRFGALLRKLPRSRAAGMLLMGLGTIWGAWLCATIDLGDFTPQRPLLLTVALALGLLMTAYSQEFLAVRGLAVLLLLGANVVLDACFLRDEPAKLVLVVNAYVWIVAALFLLFSPYLLRDWIGKATQTDRRFKWLSAGGTAFGVVLLLLGWLVY